MSSWFHERSQVEHNKIHELEYQVRRRDEHIQMLMAQIVERESIIQDREIHIQNLEVQLQSAQDALRMPNLGAKRVRHNQKLPF